MADGNDILNDVDRFFDIWNKVGFGLLIILSTLVILAVVYWNQGILSGLLVIVTGVYVFTTFNQMREARKQTNSRPIQRDIEYREEHDAEVPGIRNFGSESAYDLEFLASWESETDEDAIISRENTKLESPTTLAPDEFEPVVKHTEDFKENLKNTSRLEGGQLSLYYAYSTPSIPRVPPNEIELLDKDLGRLQEEYPEPTSFDASSLWKRCFPEE